MICIFMLKLKWSIVCSIGPAFQVPPPPPRRRPSVALGSLWPTSLTGGSETTCSEQDAGRENQLRLLLRLLVNSCLLHPLPIIFLELSWLFQLMLLENDGNFERHLGFLEKLEGNSPGLVVCYSTHIPESILKIASCCELFKAYN